MAPATNPCTYHFIIVRVDLSPGQKCAQVCHASGESASPRPKPGCHAVVLSCCGKGKEGEDHGDHLRGISQRLEASGLAHHLVIEDDGQLMAIGLQPTQDKSKVDRVLSSLPLVR